MNHAFLFKRNIPLSPLAPTKLKLTAINQEREIKEQRQKKN